MKLWNAAIGQTEGLWRPVRQLVGRFHQTTGHTHAGTEGEGPKVPVGSLSATGTPSAANVLRGDGTWQAAALFVPLTTPLTSTSWDGDSFSTVASNTQIDLSAAFNVPAGVKAVSLYVAVKDSASATTDAYLSLYPADSGSPACVVTCAGRPNDVYERQGPVTVPCDANGDIWYQAVASGAGTLDVILRVWGYWV